MYIRLKEGAKRPVLIIFSFLFLFISQSISQSVSRPDAIDLLYAIRLHDFVRPSISLRLHIHPHETSLPQVIIWFPGNHSNPFVFFGLGDLLSASEDGRQLPNSSIIQVVCPRHNGVECRV